MVAHDGCYSKIQIGCWMLIRVVHDHWLKMLGLGCCLLLTLVCPAAGQSHWLQVDAAGCCLMLSLVEHLLLPGCCCLLSHLSRCSVDRGILDPDPVAVADAHAVLQSAAVSAAAAAAAGDW